VHSREPLIIESGLFQEESTPKTQQQLLKVERKERNVEPYVVGSNKQVTLENAIMQFIAFSNRPFSIVSDPSFAQLLFMLDPRFRLLSARYEFSPVQYLV
jgi:hypothetical protein